ncbi:MAG: 3-hydroxylacyl-ACP dehydratase [Myxococcales bacterium]|jgi:3-oxoacyl-[acyl-carrier-protein] synthase-1
MSQFPPVEELLPHSAPMILVDEVLAYEASGVRGRVKIREDSMFVKDGRVPAVVAIEYMAQAIGLHAGFEARRKGNPVRIGYLLGTREMSLEVDNFEVGDELEIEVERLFGEEQLGSFRCSVSRAGKQVASAVLSVYQNNNVESPK